MIPNIDVLTTPIDEVDHPNRTYKIVRIGSTDSKMPVYYNRINGYTDDLDATKQAIYFILGTERYRFQIYSWDYGVELFDLFGKPMPFVISEIPRRIREALLTDDRISDVNEFSFEKNGNKLHVSFIVETIHGQIPTELEVMV